MVARAGSSLQRVRQMLSDLLDFARASAKPPPNVETAVAPLPQSLVGDLQPLASAAGVDLQLESTSARGVRCAAGILSSMLSNLVQNAIRHAGNGPERHVGVRALDAGTEVLFEVEDTGPGVAPEDSEGDLRALREPELRGLGARARDREAPRRVHGGRVGVHSEPGHGALFWVALPAA